MSADILLEKEINDLYLKCGLNPSNTIPVRTEINTGTLHQQFETFFTNQSEDPYHSWQHNGNKKSDTPNLTDN